MNYIALHIDCQTDFAEILIAELSVFPFDTFEERENGISAYMPEDQFDESSVADIKVRYQPHISRWEVESIEKKNWNEEWEKNYEPVIVNDKVVVRAVFHQSYPDYPYEIVINPKMSFGTGHHATTSLILKQQLEMDFTDKVVADFGTGTGVLAIMAHKLGAREIFVNDVDDWCIDNSRENFELNQVRNYEAQLGPVSQLQIDKSFDIIIANINKNVLLDEMHRYTELLKEDGWLVLSGFYEHDNEDIINYVEPLGPKFFSTETKNDWSVLVFKK